MASTIIAAPAATECNYPVKDPVLANLFDRCKFAVGTVSTLSAAEPNAALGIVSLYELARDMFALITDSHGLPLTDADAVPHGHGHRQVCEAGIVITFQGFGRLVLKPDDVVSVSTSEGLDATVVELTAKCVAHLKERGAQFLKVASARVGDQVAMLQYMYQKNELAVFKAVVREISSALIHYNPGIQDEVASAGSPLLLWDLEAVGLNNEQSISSAVATPLLDIVAFHLLARSSNVKWSAPTTPSTNPGAIKPSKQPLPSAAGEVENALAEVSLSFLGDAVFATDEAMFVTGMSADPVGASVFLSYTMKTHTHESTRWRSGVREVSLAEEGAGHCGKGLVRDAYSARELNAFVYGVGFVIATQTLLICTNDTVDGQVERCLEALARRVCAGTGAGASVWNVEHHLPFENGLGPVRFAELSDARVLFGERYWGSRVLQLLRVSPEHHIESVARIEVPDGFHTFDARVIAGDALVAFVAKDKSHVRLSRLLPSNTLQHLSRVDLPRTQKLLWSGDHLLAGYWNKEHKAYSIVEAQRSGDTIASTRVLLDEKNSFEWCFMDDRTAIFDNHTKEIFVHSAR